MRAAVLGQRRFSVTPPSRASSKRPRSAYNSVVSADGGTVAFETAESTYPLAKRVGQMTVLVRDLATGAQARVSHAYRRRARRPAPRSTRRCRPTGGSSPSRPPTPAATAPRRATASGSWTARPSASGSSPTPRAARPTCPRSPATASAVAYTSAEIDNNGLTHVYLTSLKTGRTSLVSRADGRQGRAGGGRRVRAERLARRPLRGLHEPRAQPRRRRPRGRLRARPAARDDPARDRRDQGRRRRALAVRGRPLRRLHRPRRAPERHAGEPAHEDLAPRPDDGRERARQPRDRRPRRARRTATPPTPRSPRTACGSRSPPRRATSPRPSRTASPASSSATSPATPRRCLSTHARRPGSDETPVAYLAAAGVALPLAFGAAGFFLFRRRRPFSPA